MTPNGAGSRPRLVLASASPRRRQLLEAVGVSPEQMAVDVDETPQDGELPADLVRRLAEAKASAGLRACGGRGRVVVIGADTVIALDDEIFGKPRCDAEARTMLSRLSGRCHHVLTGVAVATPERMESAVEDTLVCFRQLDAADVDCYVSGGEPRDKAGAYAIQGRGGLFVDRIEGSYHSVVGLPINIVDELCTSVGWSLVTW